MSFCISISFAAAFLQALSYSNGELGLIVAPGNIMGIVVSITPSSWIDSYEKITAKKIIPWVLALQAASIMILFLIHAKCLAVSFAFIGYIGFCTTVNCMNLKLYADADKAGYSMDYGFTRGIGSIAYVLISIVLGMMIESTSSMMLPVMGLIVCGIQFLGFTLFSNYVVDGQKAESCEKQKTSLPSFIKNNKQYAILLTGVVLLFFGHSTACNFLINLTRNVGGSTADMGLINAFKDLVEIPMLFLYGRMFTDGKHAKALRIAAIFFEITLLAFIISGNVWHLSAGFIFQAPSYALFMAAIVPYVKEKIDFKDSSKVQSLAFNTTTLGGMLASLIAGQLYDYLSVTETLWIGFIVGLVGAAILFIGTRSTKHDTREELL